MKTNGIVLRKIESIEENLGELRSLGVVTTTNLESDFFLK